MKNEFELLSVEQVATLLQVRPKTIRNWVYLRKIPFRKINGTVRFLRAEIEAWTEEGSS